jgi:hypothetical protein
MNPGGLAAVWAEENSREALYDALQRRETYATSGPRIALRFFGGWDYSPTLCEDSARVARAYAGGVPMGGDLSAPPAAGASPAFLVWAQRDPGVPEHPGGLLQRIQIVKAWAAADGAIGQAIFDVAGAAPAGAGVDPATCTPHGPGAETLCAVWRDPEFDPAQRAFYYARVLENPSCRYTGWICAALSGEQQPAWCADPAIPRTLQERAWSSPVWFTPQDVRS